MREVRVSTTTGKKKPSKLRRNRHSSTCPCREHIRTQTQLYGGLISRLGSSNFHRQKKIISSCDPCFIRYLGRCACGLLHANIRVKKRDYSALRESKDLLLALARPNGSISSKRFALINNQGGAIPLFSILSTLVSSVLGNLFFKK